MNFPFYVSACTYTVCVYITYRSLLSQNATFARDGCRTVHVRNHVDIGFAGGECGRFLSETEAWIRAHGVGSKTLGAELWDAFSAEAKSKHPRVLARHAMLKMCFVEKDQMNLSVNDVKRMLNSQAVQAEVSRAEEYMTSMRKVREKSTRTPEEIAGHIGFADIKLMEVILDRKRRDFQTMDDVYHDFLAKIDLAHLYGGPPVEKNLGFWCVGSPCGIKLRTVSS